jgi:uncharacterized protein HemX
MRFHPAMHVRQLTDRLHRPHEPEPRRENHTAEEDAEVAKATCLASAVTLVALVVGLGLIAFGQEAMHWLGVH